MLSKMYGERRGQTPAPAISMTERPDEARFDLDVSVDAESATAAVAALRRAARRLEDLATQVGATLWFADVGLPHESGKVSAAPLRIHATLRVPLSREASFWDRAQRLAQVDDVLRALAAEGRKQKPALELRRDLPAFVVADPEAYRPALVQRLHERARSLGGAEDVKLSGLRFDQPVTQSPLGLEAVQLSLAVEGFAELLLRAAP